MRVKELIARLAVEDPEMRVVVDGYECGYDEVDRIRTVRITPNPKAKEKDWEGEFEFVIDGDKEESQQIELALYLPRKS